MPVVFESILGFWAIQLLPVPGMRGSWHLTLPGGSISSLFEAKESYLSALVALGR